VSDVILFDPSDAEHPVLFNVLHAHSDTEKTLLASDLGGVFKRLSTTWGDQMTAVLGNAILAILENPRGGNLLDLRRFLIEKDFRSEYLQGVADPEVIYFWRHHFPQLSGRPQASILTRLNAFLRSRVIRNIVGQRDRSIDFSNVMDSGKIFLAKLSTGLIGEENAALLGSLLVSKFHQIAIARQSIAAEARRDFWLYCDEFHNFVTPSMASILSGTRKYRQYLERLFGILWERPPESRDRRGHRSRRASSLRLQPHNAPNSLRGRCGGSSAAGGYCPGIPSSVVDGADLARGIDFHPLCNSSRDNTRTQPAPDAQPKRASNRAIRKRTTVQANAIVSRAWRSDPYVFADADQSSGPGPRISR